MIYRWRNFFIWFLQELVDTCPRFGYWVVDHIGLRATRKYDLGHGNRSEEECGWEVFGMWVSCEPPNTRTF